MHAFQSGNYCNNAKTKTIFCSRHRVRTMVLNYPFEMRLTIYLGHVIGRVGVIASLSHGSNPIRSHHQHPCQRCAQLWISWSEYKVRPIEIDYLLIITSIKRSTRNIFVYFSLFFIFFCVLNLLYHKVSTEKCVNVLSSSYMNKFCFELGLRHQIE